MVPSDSLSRRPVTVGKTAFNSPANLNSARHQLGSEQPCFRMPNRLPFDSQSDSGAAMVYCRSFSKLIPQYLSGLRSLELASLQSFANPLWIRIPSSNVTPISTKCIAPTLQEKATTNEPLSTRVRLELGCPVCVLLPFPATHCAIVSIRPSRLRHSPVKAWKASGDRSQRPD